MSVLQLGNSCL